MDEFAAAYLSGIVSISLGNPLEVWKTRIQANAQRGPILQTPALGVALPILGYGALNAILFSSYAGTLRTLEGVEMGVGREWTAGAVAGVCTFVISAPTELIKCRAQVSGVNSWQTLKSVYQSMGVTGLYYGGVITVARDSIGYGFYFWSYAWMKSSFVLEGDVGKALATFVSGGIAGCVTWASIYPLDVVKTRYTTQTQPLLSPLYASATACARSMFAEHGASVFFRGIGITMVRSFLVNAVQFLVYESAKRLMH